MERIMLRWMLIILIAIFAIDTAVSAEAPVSKKRAVNAARQLPPGLPHQNYKYRTTITSPTHRSDLVVGPDLPGPLAPLSGVIAYIPTMFDRPLLLPGSSTIPGYYGAPSSFSYQGPYYGGPEVSYRNRLPYACGVYGYC
jgi:hypothetical protein